MRLTWVCVHRIGQLGRFPSSACIWAVRSGEEDQNKLRSSRVIWKERREGTPSTDVSPPISDFPLVFCYMQLKIDQRVFLTPSKRKLDVNIVQSNFHIEMTPSDVGNYDRVVIQDLLKEVAQTQQVDLNAKQRFKGTSVRTSGFGCCLLTMWRPV